VLTIFIVLLLGVGAALFSRDANKLMIAPIERMVKVVRKLADNPLAKLDDPEDGHGGGGGSGDDTQQFETSLVEAALRKIGMLLQIGFGEAGAEIIGKNLGSGGSVNPMLPGAHCKAVFGFCDIRNFTDATECLQEDVMVFVNLIANITHLAVKRHGGSPNKNIGDAFLVVYKTSVTESDGDQLRVASTEQVRAREMSNGALRAFLEIIDEIRDNEQLIEYSKNPAIQARMPGYEVKMGFGLHYGWAIEGAIGSSLKIDASYLSPHVNLAARLESATKAYGVPLLISGELYNNLTDENKRICRRIDKVTVKGSVAPMVLYTTDLNPPKDDPKFPGLRAYTQFFESGIDAYIAGDWATAGDKFQECLTMWKDDEPARNLLWYLSRFNFRAPATWRGFRALEDK
jgi:class 3 adenylate cyclase